MRVFTSSPRTTACCPPRGGRGTRRRLGPGPSTARRAPRSRASPGRARPARSARRPCTGTSRRHIVAAPGCRSTFSRTPSARPCRREPDAAGGERRGGLLDELLRLWRVVEHVVGRHEVEGPRGAHRRLARVPRRSVRQLRRLRERSTGQPHAIDASVRWLKAIGTVEHCERLRATASAVSDTSKPTTLASGNRRASAMTRLPPPQPRSAIAPPRSRRPTIEPELPKNNRQQHEANVLRVRVVDGPRNVLVVVGDAAARAERLRQRRPRALHERGDHAHERDVVLLVVRVREDVGVGPLQSEAQASRPCRAAISQSPRPPAAPAIRAPSARRCSHETPGLRASPRTPSRTET